MKDEDGLKKNLSKFRSEWKLLSIGMVPHWQRMRRPDLHGYVNLWVEACRISPYLVGHFLAVGVPVLGVLWVI